jgi:mannose-6-phosphate isomerase-like protein (cupin superfamily)
MADIKKVADSPTMKETLAGFTGFLGVETVSIDESTMMTHSRWVSEEACTGGAAALGKVLKEHLAAYIAGPPDAPWVGPNAMELVISGNGLMTAYRLVVMDLQEGKMQTIIDGATAKHNEFKQIDGLVSIGGFAAGPTKAVIYAGYNTKAQLEAATPKIGAIMKEMGSSFAGPPTSFLTEVAFTTMSISAPAPTDASSAPAVPAAAGSSPFAFASGLPDCCTSNPESYTVLAELPNFRLVQMKVPPGGEDKPHDHPPHSMYFVHPAKLSITDYDQSGVSKDNAHEVEIPAGACPIFPAGAHQVKNVGDSEALVLFIEAFPTCKPCGDVDGFISPFAAAPQCYKVLAENEEYYTGMLTMEPGETDPVHHHKDHLIYVLEGEQVTIYPGGDESAAMAVDIKAGAGIPAPMAAPPFAKHSLKNTGTTTLKMLFFEMKQ